MPSGLNNYALMLLAAMLPWNFFQGSIMESMGALLGNQNLIQKTYFPRELIPGATVASKMVSHLIEMGLLLVAVVCFGNWRALFFIPGVILTMAVVTIFALGLSLLFSMGNVFYRDIQHFSNIFFFIWMFLTPVAYPYYIVGGGINSPTGAFSPARYIHLFGHARLPWFHLQDQPHDRRGARVPVVHLQRGFARVDPRTYALRPRLPSGHTAHIVRHDPFQRFVG